MQPHDPFGPPPGGDGSQPPQYGQPQGQPWGAPQSQPPQGQPWGAPPAYPAQPYPPQGDGQQTYAVPTQAWGPQGPQGPQPPQGQYGPGGYGAPPAGRSSHKALYLGILAVVVVAGLVTGGVLLFSGGSGSSSSPSDTVKTYLSALARGDSAAALATGTAPPSKILVTDKILKQQQAVAKISDVNIVQAQTQGNAARVEATYTFGDQHADESFLLKSQNGKWLLTSTTVPITATSLDNLPSPQVFGVSVAKESKLYVFPGPVQITSGDPNFTISSSGTSGKKFPLSPNSYGGYLSLQASLSSTGKQKVQQAVQDAMQKCTIPHDLHPDNCPQDAYEVDSPSGAYPVDNSATWGVPTDYSGLSYRVGYSDPTSIDVSGSLVFPVKVTLQQYVSGKGEVMTPTSTTVKADLYGKVDLSSNPPAYTDGG